jgi:hypothetical protein
MPINGCMHKENVVYIHNEVLSTIEKKLLMLFSGKLMELEITMLNEISQTQKDKYHMLSPYMESRKKKTHENPQSPVWYFRPSTRTTA